MKESEERYDSPEELYEDNSSIINGKLKAENFAKLNAKYTSRVIFGFREEMAKKLYEVALISLSKKFGKDFSKTKEKELIDVINFCSEKGININDIKKQKCKK